MGMGTGMGMRLRNGDGDVHSSDDEDIRNDHIPTVNLKQDRWKPLSEEDRPATPEPSWSIPSSDLPVTIQTDFLFNKDLEYLRYGSKGGRPALSISKMKAAYYPDVGLEQMVPDQMWIEEECKYDIAAMYGISHWWFQRQRFYIDRHTSEGDRKAVRTHMRILSVVRIEVFSLYGYDYMKKIVLRRADLKEHIIAERDFKYLYPSDFEDLYLLNLQGHLNHLPPKDKKILTTAVNLWTRNLVIRQRVEDFQLGIESYQTQLNLTKPRWDATGFEYKHDFTFSDGTLHQMNPVLNTRFWTRKDVERSKEFIFAIQKRVKTRKIFRNLESFVGGRDGMVRYSFPRSRQSRRDLPRDNPLVSVEVLSTHDEDGNPSRANVKQALVDLNPLVHSFRALSTLRRSGLRTASAATKPCQGNSSEFYLITEFNPSEDPSSDHIPPLPAILPFLSSDDDTTDSDTPDISQSPAHAKVIENQVMAISVISISSDSSEDSVGTPTGRVILFGTIPTTIPDTTPVITPPATQTDTPVIPTETPIIAPTIPPSPDYTPASPDYSPASDSESDPSEDPSSDHIPPLPDISPFLSSDDDPTDSDTPDTPSSPTHDTPFTEITASTQRSPIIPRRRVMILSPGQPIPHGRPYRYHLNGPVHMMTARKRVGPLPTHRLAVRHSADHSSSDSSSEASSDFHSDASSDPSSRHPLSDHSSPDLPTLSPVRADLIPSSKRVKDSGYLTDVEVDPREISLRDDAIVRVNALRDRGIDVRVVVEAIDRDETETETGVRGLVEVRVERVTHPVMPEDILEPAQEGAVKATYETLGDLVQRKMPNTLSGASMTREEFEELVTRRVAEEMEAREAARTLEPLNENVDEQEGENGGNGNRNRNHGMNYGGFMPVARECTFQDFLKCKPQNFSGTKGVVRLTRWFEKMETVFNISNCPSKYQVKYATCTLQDSALTWWNSHKRTIGVEAAYAMN
ncbi:hypothetical protein Tco_0116515 [Tanacetum coccineum]